MTTNPTPQPTTTTVDQLVDQLARRGVGVVRAQPGDTLLLVTAEDLDAGHNPDDGPAPSEQIMTQLTAALPAVGILILHSTIGAVVVPPAGYIAEPDPASQLDEYHATGVYCGEPSHCTEPFPDALPGTPYTPAYVHDLLDAFLHPERPLSFGEHWVPGDVQQRLTEAHESGQLAGVPVDDTPPTGA